MSGHDHDSAPDARHERAYRIMTSAVNAAFDAYLIAARAAVLDHDTRHVTAAADPGDLPPNLDTWPPRTLWATLIRKHVIPAGSTVYRYGWDSQLPPGTGPSAGPGTPPPAAAWSVDDYQQAWLAAADQRLTGSTWPDEVYNAIRDQVRESHDQRESFRELRERVRQVLTTKHWAGHAETIARTEGMSALNNGAYSAGLARQRVFGEPLYKSWLAVRDDRTRQDHKDVDGTSVPADEPFRVGGELLQHPHDPRGTAENNTNCRCVLQWHTEDEINARTSRNRRTSMGDEQIAAVAGAEPAAVTAAPDDPTIDPAADQAGDAGGDAVTTIEVTEKTETSVTKTTTRTVADDAATSGDTTSPPSPPGPASVTAAASGSTTLPLADTDITWEGPAAAAAIKQWATSDNDTIDWDKYGQGFFYQATPSGDGPKQGDFKLPFATVINGTLVAVPQAVMGAAAALQGSRGGVDIPRADLPGVRAKVAAYYEKLGRTPPWHTSTGDGTAKPVTAAAGGGSWVEQVAANVPMEPDPACFAQPPGPRGTKMHIVNDQGWVAGYIADWDATHRGFDVPPPRDPYGGGYPKFHRHGVRCNDGSMVMTGPVATNGHGDPANTNLSSVMAHYDDPRFCAANVRVSETEHGIWASGTLRPGVPALQAMLLDTYSQSGHWMPGTDGVPNELVATCCVSVEGYDLDPTGTVRTLAAAAGQRPPAAVLPSQYRDDHGRLVAIVAAGIVTPADQPAAPLTVDGWDLYRQFKAAARIDERVTATRRRLSQPRVLAAAARMRGKE